MKAGFARRRIRLALLVLLMLLSCTGAICEKQAIQEHGMAYRALLIGQSYAASGTLSPMPACIVDAKDMADMLGSMTGTAYQTTVCTDLDAEGIRQALTEVFSQAEPGDVTLFFFAGHGIESDDASRRGALLGTDGNTLPLPELCRMLCGFHGRKTVILDSCCSGSIIPILSEMQSRGEGLDICALCATDSFEKTNTIICYSTGAEYGAFTAALLAGSGYGNSAGQSLPADRDGDAAVSLMEAYYYVKSRTDGTGSTLRPTVWPRDHGIILWQRGDAGGPDGHQAD